MSSFVEKIRQDKKAVDDFYRCVIAQSEAVARKPDTYIFCSNIVTDKGIEYFPVISRSKCKTLNDCLNPDNYTLLTGKSEMKIKLAHRSDVPVTDVVHGIKLIGVSESSTIKRLESSFKDLMKDVLKLAKQELQDKQFKNEKEAIAALDQCLCTMNYTYDPDLKQDIAGFEEDRGVVAKEKRSFFGKSNDCEPVIDGDYDLGDANDNGVPDAYDIDLDHDGFPDYS